MNNQYTMIMNNSEDLEDEELKPILIGPYGENRVPLAIEFVFAVARIITIVSAVLVTIFSLINHAHWLILVIRLAVTIGVIGLLGYCASWLVGRFYIHAAVNELKDIEAKIQEKNAEKTQFDQEY